MWIPISRRPRCLKLKLKQFKVQSAFGVAFGRACCKDSFIAERKRWIKSCRRETSRRWPVLAVLGSYSRRHALSTPLTILCSRAYLDSSWWGSVDSNSTNFLITTTSSNTTVGARDTAERWAGKACVIISPHRSSPVFVLPLISMIYRRFFPFSRSASRLAMFCFLFASFYVCTERSRWWWRRRWFSYFYAHFFSVFCLFADFISEGIRNGSGLVAMMERSDGL